MNSEIEVVHYTDLDIYLGMPQQLLSAGLITEENLAILNGGKRSLRIFPDGRIAERIEVTEAGIYRAKQGRV